MCVWILIWIWLWICTWTYFIQCRNERTQLYRYSGKDKNYKMNPWCSETRHDLMCLCLKSPAGRFHKKLQSHHSLKWFRQTASLVFSLASDPHSEAAKLSAQAPPKKFVHYFEWECVTFRKCRGLQNDTRILCVESGTQPTNAAKLGYWSYWIAVLQRFLGWASTGP